MPDKDTIWLDQSTKVQRYGCAMSMSGSPLTMQRATSQVHGQSISTEVTVYAELGALPLDVQSFLSEQYGDDLCLSLDWFELLQRYSPTKDHRPRIYVVRVGGIIEGVLFAMSSTPGNRPRRLSSLTNFYTMSYAPVLRRSLADSRSTLGELAAFIANERPAWDIVELRGLIEEHSTTGELVNAFRRAGMLVDTFFQFENWFLMRNGLSADEYFKSRPSQLRNTIVRKLKKAQKEHKVHFSMHASVADLLNGLEAYQKIYAQSWKEPETHPEFIPQLLRRSAEQGCLRLGVLRVDDEPAAAQIWLLSGKRATIYKLAYDERFASMSVGSILTKMMADYVLGNDDIAEIDYGVGSEPYKRDWMTDRRHIVGMICFNLHSMVGLIAAGRHLAGRLKHWLRRKYWLRDDGDTSLPSKCHSRMQNVRPASAPDASR